MEFTRYCSRPAIKAPGFGFGALSMALFPNVDTNVPFTWVGFPLCVSPYETGFVMRQFTKLTLRQADAVSVLSKMSASREGYDIFSLARRLNRTADS
jgi:hypothetical protein